MNFLSLFTAKSPKTKEIQAADALNIYLDYSLKSYQQIKTNEGVTVEELLEKLQKVQSNYSQHGKNSKIGLVLVTYDSEQRIVVKRRISNTDQPFKLLIRYSNNNALVLENFDQSRLDVTSLRSRQNIMMVQAQVNEKWDRIGPLYKKVKSGQYKEKQFKLLPHSLIYFKEQNKMKYISLETLEVKQDDKKDRYAFKLISDSKTYHLKANNQTDMDGWIYAIRKQIMIIKHEKLFHDINKQILINIARTIDEFKEQCCAWISSTSKILSSSAGIYILDDFKKYLIKAGKLSDLQYLLFLIQSRKGSPEEIQQSYQVLSKQLQSDLQLGLSGGIVYFLSRKVPQKDLFQILNNISDENMQKLIYYITKYFDKKYLEEFKRKSNLISIIGTVPLMKFQRRNHFQKPIFDSFYCPEDQTPSKAVSPTHSNTSKQTQNDIGGPSLYVIQYLH